MKSPLFLRLDPNIKPGEYRYGEMFLVYDETDHWIGRVYYEGDGYPGDSKWFWMVDIYRWPPSSHPKEKHFGNVETKEQAMAAVRRIWDMRPE